MRISDVAAGTGLPVSTIRYYEKRAIIPKPARNGRDRSFSDTDIKAIEFVRDAQSLGLSLAEISTLLHGNWGSGALSEIATEHREKVSEKIKALKRIDTVLAALESCACDSFAKCDLNTAPCGCDD